MMEWYRFNKSSSLDSRVYIYNDGIDRKEKATKTIAVQVEIQ
jgi:hypothetical protein